MNPQQRYDWFIFPLIQFSLLPLSKMSYLFSINCSYFPTIKSIIVIRISLQRILADSCQIGEQRRTACTPWQSNNGDPTVFHYRVSRKSPRECSNKNYVTESCNRDSDHGWAIIDYEIETIASTMSTFEERARSSLHLLVETDVKRAPSQFESKYNTFINEVFFDKLYTIK